MKEEEKRDEAKTSDFTEALEEKLPHGADRVEEGLAYDATDYDQVGDKTLEDYLALPEGTRIEMIDGVFYDMAAPSPAHSRIAVRLGHLFESIIDKNKGDCIPFIAPADVQLDCDNKTMVQPDLFIVCDKKRIILPWIYGAPDLVVEIVSPSNRRMDTVKKKEKYKKAGVREYWLVFPEEKTVVVHCFEMGTEPKLYTFRDKIPVQIWGGRDSIDFADIARKLEELKYHHNSD